VTALAAAAHFGFTSLSGRVIFPSLEYAVRVHDFVSSIFSQKTKVVHEAIWNEYFDDDVPYNSGGSNYDANEMLMSTERDQLEGLTTTLDNE
jgi:hypothetical protein